MKLAGISMLILAVALLPVGTWGETDDFKPNAYYILSLGPVSVDIDTLVETALGASVAVAQTTGLDYEIQDPESGTDPDFPTFLQQPETLVVDGDRFRLRMVSDEVTYTVRPASSGYDLVIIPTLAVPVSSTLESIVASLCDLGIVGTELSLELRTYPRTGLKGPAPPTDTPIDSALYGLVVAENWFSEATKLGLTLVGLRVEVVAELGPGGSVPAAFSVYVVQQAEETLKLLMPIEQLVALARAEEIAYVRPPHRPAVP